MNMACSSHVQGKSMRDNVSQQDIRFAQGERRTHAYTYVYMLICRYVHVNPLVCPSVCRTFSTVEHIVKPCEEAAE